jgi:hypothetical protein
MAYILKGDLILVDGKQAIATSDDYIRSVPGTGEYVDDWTFVPTVEYIRPETGVTGRSPLRNVQKI